MKYTSAADPLTRSSGVFVDDLDAAGAGAAGGHSITEKADPKCSRGKDGYLAWFRVRSLYEICQSGLS